MDELASRLTLNQEVAGANPASASIPFSCGVIGNISHFDCEVLGSIPSGRFCPCDGTGIRAGLRNQILWVRLPPRVSINSRSKNMVSEVEVVETLVCEASY